MGLGHNGTGTQRDWGHNINRTQWDWGKMGPGQKQLVLAHNGTEAQWDWDTMRLGL